VLVIEGLDHELEDLQSQGRAVIDGVGVSRCRASPWRRPRCARSLRVGWAGSESARPGTGVLRTHRAAKTLDAVPYGAYSLFVKRIVGAEAARQNLPEILDRASKGDTTIVTRRGRPVAAVVPTFLPAKSGPSLLSLRGSGRGLWGEDPGKTIRSGRKSWP
jgi:prevent-host-death family protein